MSFSLSRKKRSTLSLDCLNCDLFVGRGNQGIRYFVYTLPSLLCVYTGLSAKSTSTGFNPSPQILAIIGRTHLRIGQKRPHWFISMTEIIAC